MTLRSLLAIGAVFAFTAHAQASIIVDPTTSDGTLPGTSITYTVSDAGGTARAIWPAGTSDSGTWTWTNAFPEFVTAAGQTLTVTFSAPAALTQFILGVNSLTNSSATLSVSGGTATTADFDLTDGNSVIGGHGVALYDPATGTFTAASADETTMLGSTSSNTITSFSLVANGLGDGFTLFFGPTEPVTPIPEPLPLAVLAIGGLSLVALRRGQPRPVCIS
jgi:hypothetical protein